MKTTQTTLQDRFQWIESLHFLLASKLITQRDFLLLTGNYKTLTELPSVEQDLPPSVKSDLETQRLLTRSSFKGIASSKPITVIGFLRNVGAILGEINDDFEGGEKKE